MMGRHQRSKEAMRLGGVSGSCAERRRTRGGCERLYAIFLGGK